MQRHPALLVAVAFVAGIAADRWFEFAMVNWLLLSAVSLAIWLLFSLLRKSRLAVVLLLLACASAAGARHHQFWSVRAVNDISHFAASERRLVRLQGIVCEHPWIRKADGAAWQSAIPQIDRTQCIVSATAIESSHGRTPVSGRAHLTVSGHLLHVAVGDEVEVVGWLSEPRPPGNPGQFNFGEYLQRQGCRCLLFANHPAAVTKLRDGAQRPRRLLSRFREDAELLCVSHLSQPNLALATALLLGDRSRMTDDIRDSFSQSGTAHILAISGLHVGILAALLWLCCRLFNTRPRMTALVIVAGVVLYAVISGGRPPVSRATVFVLIAVGGFLLNRPAVAMNTLALALIAVLAWNPSDLFDVGTQLSFLAVTGIIVAQQWRPGAATERVVTLEEEGTLRSRVRGPVGWLLRGYGMMCGIWLLTAPLTAARFHLVSPLGFLINVLLIPFVCILLWSGFAFLIVGLLVPYAAVPLGFLFDIQLTGLLWIVNSAAATRLGHLYGPGPATAWMGIYYLLVAGVTYALLRRWKTRRVVQTLLVWTVAGLAVDHMPQERPGLRCTFLDMGHGCSVLMEMPNGKTLLYDAGSLTSARRAERTVESALWSRRIEHLDGVIISHADVDHFNGIHGLLERVPVGSLMMSQSFLDFEQRSVRELCDVIERKRIPVLLVQRGDCLRVDDRVAVKVLHPPGNERFDNDNENSVTLLVDYAGRRILLTGDLEKSGLRSLLTTPAVDVDVMLSPHHGSRAANPPELARWANPEWVVVGARDDRALHYLRDNYGADASVLTTGDDGALTFRIRPDGSLDASAGRHSLLAERVASPRR